MSSKLFFGLFVEIALALLFSGVLSKVLYCDYHITFEANDSYYNAHHYQLGNDSQENCIYQRYIFVAPVDYEINIQCDINLGKTDSKGRCVEHLILSIDGDLEMRNSEHICGHRYVQRKSLFNRLLIAIPPHTYRASDSISCTATTIPQPCDCGWSGTSKSAGGVVTKINEYPFIVALVDTSNDIRNDFTFCEGFIISHRHILTAAHCIKTESDFISAIVGGQDWNTEDPSTYGRRIEISSIKLHENYEVVNYDVKANTENDIAILYTSTDIEWSRGVGPICLPFLLSEATFYGWKADVPGWGETYSVVINTTVDIISNSQCKDHHAYLTSSHICNSLPLNYHTCLWNSAGGPLIVRRERMIAAGVINRRGVCGSNTLGINARVTSHLEWIQKNTGVNFCQRT